MVVKKDYNRGSKPELFGRKDYQEENISRSCNEIEVATDSKPGASSYVSSASEVSTAPASSKRRSKEI